MKQKGMKNDQPHIHEEIIINILKRLPVKSLIRFQCVCKHWKNLMKNPSLVADHLRRSSLQNPSLLFQFNTSDALVLWNSRLTDSGKPTHQIQKPPLIDTFDGASILGSCNGLLCVEIDEYLKSRPSLLLWNPATTAVKHVPRTRNDWESDNCVTGFGFSPVLNDYKIVRIYYKDYDTVNAVGVFSLSTGSWKEIDIGNLVGLKLHSETVSANGAIFWSGSKLDASSEDEDEEHYDDDDFFDDDDVIVSFDIANELFTSMPRPFLDFVEDERLVVYENKLAVLCNIWNEDEDGPHTIDLWAMEEEGACAPWERRNWTRIYTTNRFSSQFYSIAMWGNEIVLKASYLSEVDKERTYMSLINVTTGRVTRFNVPYCGHFCGVNNYVESLISVDERQLH